MAALSFKGSFVDRILDGTKTQTIRNYRKYPLRVGETLYLYYGLRTKNSKKLKDATCKAIYHIIIDKDSVLIFYRGAELTQPSEGGGTKAQLAGERVAKVIKTQKELDEFAYADGFENWATMKRWWSLTHGDDCFPFTGQLIMW